MAAVRGSESNQTDTFGTLNVNVPAGTADGDVLIAFVSCDDGPDVTPAEVGWTTGPESESAHKMSCFHRIISGSPPATYGFTTASGAGLSAHLIAINPDGDTDPVVTNSGNPTRVDSTTSATPNLTGAAAPCVLVCGFNNDSAFTVGTPPATMDAAEFTNPASASMATYTEIDPADDPITRTLVWSGNDSTYAVAYLVAFTEGGGGSGSPYTLDADPGAFEFTGTEAFFERVVAADPGVFVFTGTDATLTFTPVGGVAPSEATGSRASISIGISL